MTVRVLRIIFGLLLAGSMGVVQSGAASAQVSIGVAPSIIQLDATPGATGEQTLQVSNNGNAAVPATVEVAAYPDLAASYSAVDWVTVAETDVDLQPNEQTPITVQFAVPTDAPTGGAYARILITTGKNENGQGVQIGGQLAIGVLFEVTGDGDFRRDLSATEFSPTLEQDGRVGFRGEVRNDGNTLALLTGQMEFMAMGESEPTASLQLNSTRVLPSVTASVGGEGTLPLPAGSQWSTETTLYPGDAAEIEDLESFTIESSFTVDPGLAINASICENLDRGPTVTFEMTNSGTIGLVPVVSIVLVDASGNSVASIDPRDTLIAWPGESTSIPIEGLSQLTGGDYTLRVTAQIVQGLDPIVTEVPFSIGGFRDNVAPLCGSEPATPDSTPAD